MRSLGPIVCINELYVTHLAVWPHLVPLSPILIHRMAAAQIEALVCGARGRFKGGARAQRQVQ